MLSEIYVVNILYKTCFCWTKFKFGGIVDLALAVISRAAQRNFIILISKLGFDFYIKVFFTFFYTKQSHFQKFLFL